MSAYEELFARNYGVFAAAEQERLRRASVLIVGCGGIGGTVALILARSGVGRFILVDFDVYSDSNMNRQIACYDDTLGRNKAEVLAEHIRRINPEAVVETHPRLLNHAEIAEIIPAVDIVFPAADDMAFSICVFRDCQRLGKPALFVVPSGTWANVAIIRPDGPDVEAVNGVPRLPTYAALKEMFAVRRYKFGTFFYVPHADWRIEYYRDFIERDRPPTQLCPVVWLCSSLGALEVLKVLSGKWAPVATPRYWSIRRESIRIQRINGLSLQTLLVWQRRIMWQVFQTPLGCVLTFFQWVWWPWFNRRHARRQARKDQGAGR